MARRLVAASSNGYVNLTPIITAYPFTIYGWGLFQTKPTSGYTPFAAVNAGGYDGADVYYQGQFTADEVIAHVETGGGEQSAASLSGVTTNVWFNYVGVFTNSTDRRIYLNGSAGSASTNAKALPTLNRVTVGCRWNSGSSYHEFLNGDVADIGFVPAAASAPEIASYAAGNSGKIVWPAGSYGGRSSERVHWDFFGVSGPDETDTINGIVLTAMSTPAQSTHPSLSYGGSGLILPDNYHNGGMQLLNGGFRS